MQPVGYCVFPIQFLFQIVEELAAKKAQALAEAEKNEKDKKGKEAKEPAPEKKPEKVEKQVRNESRL